MSIDSLMKLNINCCMLNTRRFLFGFFILAACGDDTSPLDATADSRVDVGTEDDVGTPDAGFDAGHDGGTEGDAGFDGGMLDETAPELTILSPSEGRMTPASQITVRGTASDDTLLAEVVSDGVAIEVSPDGTFEARVTLTPGINTLRFTARDDAGNETEQSVEVYFGHRISVGNSQGALLRGGSLYTWGRNELGQLGNGTLDGSGWGDDPVISALPVRYEVALPGAVSIVNRQTFMVALLDDGTVSTWGSNSDAQLGYAAEEDCGSGGTSPCRRTPTSVPGVVDAIAIGAGFDHAMVLLKDGGVMTWGGNSDGQLGYATETEAQPTPTRVPELSGIIQVAAGSTSSFALDDEGHVWAWGENDHAQLGTGAADAEAHVTPALIAGLEDVTAIASANTTAYALLADGTVVAWGRNHAGQAGIGVDTGEDVLIPTPMVTDDEDGTTAPLRDVVNVAGDGFVGLALTRSGQVYTCGLGSLGQLGQGALEDGNRDLTNRVHASEVFVADADRALFVVQEIEVGAGGPTLGLSRDGHLFGWGWSFRGSLGLDGAINAWAYSTPVLVLAAE